MSILSTPAPVSQSFVPAGMVDVACAECGAAIVVYRRAESPVRCAACECEAAEAIPAAFVPDSTPDAQFAVETALQELCAHVRALRTGAAPFDVLTPEERQEQLDALLLADDARPVAELSNDELIALIAEDANTPFPRLLAASMEIDRRLKAMRIDLADADALDAAERQRIETEDEEYAHELTLRRERDVQRDTVLAGRTGWAEDGDAFNSDFGA